MCGNGSYKKRRAGDKHFRFGLVFSVLCKYSQTFNIEQKPYVFYTLLYIGFTVLVVKSSHSKYKPQRRYL